MLCSFRAFDSVISQILKFCLGGGEPQCVCGVCGVGGEGPGLLQVKSTPQESNQSQRKRKTPEPAADSGRLSLHWRRLMGVSPGPGSDVGVGLMVFKTLAQTVSC